MYPLSGEIPRRHLRQTSEPRDLCHLKSAKNQLSTFVTVPPLLTRKKKRRYCSWAGHSQTVRLCPNGCKSRSGGGALGIFMFSVHFPIFPRRCVTSAAKLPNACSAIGPRAECRNSGAPIKRARAVGGHQQISRARTQRTPCRDRFWAPCGAGVRPCESASGLGFLSGDARAGKSRAALAIGVSLVPANAFTRSCATEAPPPFSCLIESSSRKSIKTNAKPEN